MVNRVTGASTPAITAGRAKSGLPATGLFSIAAESPATQEAAPAHSVNLSAMLALQEAETDIVQDKAARRQGFAMLEALSALQKDLLSPSANEETTLAALNRLAAEVPQTTDPNLTTLLDSIRLRAKIELLRRGVQNT
jgi:hypothetical protein